MKTYKSNISKESNLQGINEAHIQICREQILGKLLQPIDDLNFFSTFVQKYFNAKICVHLIKP